MNGVIRIPEGEAEPEVQLNTIFPFVCRFRHTALTPHRVGMCYKARTKPPLLRGESYSSSSVGMEFHVVLDVIPQVGTITTARETVNTIFIEPLNPARRRPCAFG